MLNSELKDKLRCKGDLLSYMILRLNCHLPHKRYVRLNFLQQILSEEKKVLFRDEVSQHEFNSNFPEYTVKNVYNFVKESKELRSYLPTDEMDIGRYPDKNWFWSICWTILPVWANAYHHKVLNNRIKEEKHDLDETKNINVSEKWMTRLMKYDHKSKGGKYAKGRHSILLKQIVKPKKEVVSKRPVISLTIEQAKQQHIAKRKEKLQRRQDDKISSSKSRNILNEQIDEKEQSIDKQSRKSKQLLSKTLKVQQETLNQKETPGKNFDCSSMFNTLGKQKLPNLAASKKRAFKEFESQTGMDDVRSAEPSYAAKRYQIRVADLEGEDDTMLKLKKIGGAQTFFDKLQALDDEPDKQIDDYNEEEDHNDLDEGNLEYNLDEIQDEEEAEEELE